MNSEHAHSPWELFGESLLFRVSGSPKLELPSGVHRLSNSSFVLIERFRSSPVGEFLCFAIGYPARMGIRPGIAFSTVAVSSEKMRTAARQEWGFPVEVADLRWGAYGNQREFVWDERGLSIRIMPATVPFPIAFAVRSLQRRDDGNVVVPLRLRGLARRARIEIEEPTDERMAFLSGERKGWYWSSNRVRMLSARRTFGAWASIRAPFAVPNPRLRPGEAP